MGVLIFIIQFLMVISFSIKALGLTPDEAMQIRKGWGEAGFHKDHCSVTKEYIKTLKFLREDLESQLPENQVRKIAEIVTAGCDGAADRFIKAFLTLKKSGVSMQKTVEIALVLSRANPATVDNFYEVFKKLYLKEFFDFDYKTSLEATLALSVNYQGSLENALTDFNKLSDFCLSNKKLGLSVIQCSELSLKVAKLSQYYKTGVYSSFEKIFEILRGDSKFSLSIRDALISSEKILSHGPMAVDNFLSAYEFASSKQGLSLSSKEAIEFSLKMVKRSHKGGNPPIFPGDHLMPATFSK